MNYMLNEDDAGIPGFWEASMGHLDMHIEYVANPLNGAGSMSEPIVVLGVSRQSHSDAEISPNIIELMRALGQIQS
jgi:hypothetical protein